MTFNNHAKTVENAGKQVGIKRNKIIKSLLIVDEKRVPIRGIIFSNKKVNKKTLRSILNFKDAKTISTISFIANI